MSRSASAVALPAALGGFWVRRGRKFDPQDTKPCVRRGTYGQTCACIRVRTTETGQITTSTTLTNCSWCLQWLHQVQLQMQIGEQTSQEEGRGRKMREARRDESSAEHATPPIVVCERPQSAVVTPHHNLPKRVAPSRFVSRGLATGG